MRYQIENTASSCIFGIYVGSSPTEALDALARYAGYENHAQASEELGFSDCDLLVTELED